jgi:ankyrin repeat protein
MTPLHLCADAGAAEAVEALLQRGAIATQENVDGTQVRSDECVSAFFGIRLFLTLRSRSIATYLFSIL